jgi:hypothetical protein
MKSRTLQLVGYAGVLALGFCLGSRYPVQPDGLQDRPAVTDRQKEGPALAAFPGASVKQGGNPSRDLEALDNVLSPVTGSARDFLNRLLVEPGRIETQYLLFRSVEAASREQLEQWAHGLAVIPGSESWQREALELVAKRWGTMDPGAALAWAGALPSDQRQSGVASVLGGLAVTDPAQALALVRALPAGTGADAALIAVADVVRRNDPASAYALVKGMTSNESSLVISEALAAWARIDPQAALAAVAGGAPSLPGRENHYYYIYAAWARNDPQAAMASAGQMLPANERKTALAAAFGSWAGRDPDAALKYALSMKPADRPSTGLNNVLSSIWKANPAEAKNIFETLPPDLRQTGISGMVSSWAHHAPDAALQWVNGLTNPREKSAALEGLASQVSQLDSEKRQTLIGLVAEGKPRRDFVKNIIGNLASIDPAGASVLLQHLDPAVRQNVVMESSLIGYLSNKDPEAAFQLAASLPGSNSGFGMDSTIARIAAKDPARAESLVMALPADQQRSVLPAMYASMAAQDVSGALAKARGLTDASLKQAAVTQVMQSWASSDSQGLLEWAGTASASERRLAQATVIENQSYSDPQAAAALLGNYLRDGSPQDDGNNVNLVSQVAAGLFRDDPKQALGWVDGLPAGQAKDTGIMSVASSWVIADPVEASIWMRTLPTGPARDGAVNQLISNITASDPASAVAWAGSLQDPTNRDQAMKGIFQTWIRQDQAAALEALDAAALDADQKDSLRQQASP